MSWTSLSFSFLAAPTRTKLGQMYDNTVHASHGLSEYGVDAGTVNAIAVTLTPAPASYSDVRVIRFKALFTNSGAATINVNSLGAVAIQKNGAALTAGQIVAGMVHKLIYDGTYFQLILPIKTFY